MVCQTEQAIGFHWVRGKWKSTDFIVDSFIIEKRDVRAAEKPNAGCLGMSAKAGAISGKEEISLPGCLPSAAMARNPATLRSRYAPSLWGRKVGNG